MLNKRKSILKKTKTLCLLVMGTWASLPTRACELCKDNQPKALRNITHGTGPQGDVDWIIIWSAVIIVGITLFLSLKYLIKPKEDQAGHIKNIVVEK